MGKGKEMTMLTLPETDPRPTMLQSYHNNHDEVMGDWGWAYDIPYAARKSLGAAGVPWGTVAGPARGRWKRGKPLTRQDVLRAAERLRQGALQYGQHENESMQIVFERVERAMAAAKERHKQEQALIDEAIRRIGPAPTDDVLALTEWRKELFVMTQALRNGWGPWRDDGDGR